jgi:hypothetical protein
LQNGRDILNKYCGTVLGTVLMHVSCVLYGLVDRYTYTVLALAIV